MISALIGLVVSASQTAPVQNQPSQYGEVSINGKLEPITMPDLRPSQDSRPSISLPNGQYAFVSLDEIGPRRAGTGSASPQDENPQGQPIRIKVIVCSDALIEDVQADGRHIRRRSTMADVQVSEVKTALGQLAFMVRRSGLPQPTFDLVDDDSPAMFIAGPGSKVASGDLGKIDPSTSDDGQLFGRYWLKNLLGPRINNDAFASDDPTYRGPFFSVFVIHAGLVKEKSFAMLGATPASVLPYWGCGPEPAKEALAVDLYAEFQRQSLMRLPGRAFGADDPATVGPLDRRERSVLPVYREPLTIGAKAVAALPIQNFPSFQPGYGSTVAQFSAGGKTLIAATGPGLDLLKSREADVTAVASTRSKLGSVWVVVEPKTRAPSLCEWFGAAVPMSAGLSDVIFSPADTLRADLEPFGDFSAALADVENEKVIKVNRQGIHTRGFVVLTHNRHEPIFASGAHKSLRFKVKSKSRDDYAVNLHGKSGEIVASYVLNGDNWLPTGSAAVTVTKSRVPFDDTWQNVVLDVNPSADIFSVSFGPPPYGSLVTRSNGGPQEVLLSPLKIGEPVQPTGDTPSAVDDFWAKVGTLDPSQLSEPQFAAVKAAIETRSALMMVQAASVLSATKDPKALEWLKAMASDIEDSSALIALEALAKIGTPEAQAAIDEVTLKGAFDFNRLMAVRHAAKSLDAYWPGHINMLLTLRDWQLREKAVRLAERCPGQPVSVVLIASLQDPDPAVRFAITQTVDPSIELVSRRLLYQAVNDSSEWVRAVCYVKLLASQDQKVVSEAAMGVRDDSSHVKMTVLQTMVAAPRPEFRDALRAAMLDKDPAVLSLTLDALRASPGDVTYGEVATAGNSPYVSVQLALLNLAKAKGFKPPADVLTRLSASADPQVSALAKEIAGSR